MPSARTKSAAPAGLCAILLASCGAADAPPAVDFTGTWSGTLGGPQQCSGGSAQEGSTVKTLVIRQSGASASVVPGDCGTVAAHVSGEVLTLDPQVTCPALHEQDGTTVVVTLESGRFTFSRDALAAELEISQVRTDSGGEHRCSAHVTGTLARAP